MITADQALALVLTHTIQLPTEEVPLIASTDRILREDLLADRDFPPFNRVAMDGIAINYASFEQGQRRFSIEAIAAAGSPQKRLENEENCLEVMTGAVLPEGADTVIRYEDVETKARVATITIDAIKAKQNVHHQGSDQAKGSLIATAGTRITTGAIGVAATIGKSSLQVAALPKAIVISTGDELVGIDETPLPHQIRSSNVIQLQAVLKQWGVQADSLHLADDKALIEEQVKTVLSTYQLVILSGGVSKGKYDYVPEVLANLGVEKLFHKVAQRPGKPFWFGKAASGALVFALPGNPVSSFMCAHRYVRSWLQASLGMPSIKTFAQLTEGVTFKPNLTYFMQVRLSQTEAGQLLATPVHGRGSGDLANLTHTDAFMILPQGKGTYDVGEGYEVVRV